MLQIQNPGQSNGPYETEAAASAAAQEMRLAASARWEEQARDSGPVVKLARRLSPGEISEVVQFRALERACKNAGVELGAFDRQKLLWLAGWEPEMVQVLIGVISRAARRDVAGFDAAHFFEAMGTALRMRAGDDVPLQEHEMLTAVAAVFELVAEGLGGRRALHFQHWREVLAPLVESLKMLGLQRRAHDSNAGGAR